MRRDMESMRCKNGYMDISVSYQSVIELYLLGVAKTNILMFTQLLPTHGQSDD